MYYLILLTLSENIRFERMWFILNQIRLKLITLNHSVNSLWFFQDFNFLIPPILCLLLRRMAQRGGPLKPLGMVATQCQAMPRKGATPLGWPHALPCALRNPSCSAQGPCFCCCLLSILGWERSNSSEGKGQTPLGTPFFFYPIFFYSPPNIDGGRKKKGPLVKLHKKNFFLGTLLIFFIFFFIRLPRSCSARSKANPV